MLLVLTFNAVFSHLKLTNGCAVKNVNEKKSFADLPYLFWIMLEETNNFFGLMCCSMIARHSSSVLGFSRGEHVRNTILFQ